MTRLLGVLTAVLLLAACGNGSSPGDAPATRTAQPDTGFVASERLVSQTAGGGAVADRATPLPDAAAVAAFTRDFEAALAAKVRAAAGAISVASGQQLLGQVVSVGCDVPPGVTVERDPLAVRADPVASPKKECFAPVTTVALVVVTAG
ncbi:hypothetical protein [Nocardioides sp. CER19]|uniref:hypothetical protein n=1 Tax=Nocardioides sp. CER19 TaxID=3038538 RepID=UPI002448BF90|nr:hypothetical protein [Nocardioides sp. CER19]MDH2414755.1 hypothetical protein [Nocardioides sp. CER19]